MSKDKKREIVSRFRIGTHGGCEALLYEFRERRPFISKEDEPESQRAAPPLGSHAVYIAAATFEEAFTYLLWERPDFKVDRVDLSRPDRNGFGKSTGLDQTEEGQ